MNDEAHQSWLGVVSREHVLRGVEGGFIQLNHGKKASLQRMQANDFIVIYSPPIARFRPARSRPRPVAQGTALVRPQP